MSFDVAVVGAGAIGLLSAYHLSLSGRRVVLVERGEPGREASWAGGGIVSPLYPWRYQPAVTALAHWSQDFYPALGERLRQETGIDPEVEVTGLYWLDLEDEAEALEWARRNVRPLSSVSMDEVRGRVPVLGAGYERAVFMAGVANVRNPRLVRSLREALLRMPNVTLLSESPVTGFLRQGERVTGVQTAREAIHAESVVVCAGAWSGELLRTLGLAVPVNPVKGQMLLYRQPEGYLSSMVLAKGRYAIPRRDGHILIGSTLEHAEFDKTPTAEALASLQTSAAELLPALAAQAPVAHWAGLRPGSPDGVPFIGPVAELPGLWLNCGHYRNGLVLAPASCQLLTDLLTKRTPIIDPAPYAPAARLRLG
ncbi:glycine oxidase ThiO [Pseudomonas sp. EpS/L25]|uniref:glycine oxidase ThiO n=1 Tax=Pseudomonas sp. EpS/L25 TaxID=1749078 RepID=UPI000743229D|nr:glycine oxidase ThiO [Pseudomonas sp. EpS/L25]KUM40110.1 FAD-binding oxidoreductase [Pseudomonas sp. EpS/L25]